MAARLPRLQVFTIFLSLACTLGGVARAEVAAPSGLRFAEEPGDSVEQRDSTGDAEASPTPPLLVNRNSELTLNCLPDPPSASISWLHDGQPLASDSRRRLLKNNTALYFKKVVHKRKWNGEAGRTGVGGQSDAGEYRCLISTGKEGLISRPLHLHITGISHDFTDSPENSSVVEGGLARLMCSIDSIPPARITWLKDSTPLPQDKRYFIISSGILYIYNITLEDQGKYRCEAVNDVVQKTRLSGEAVLVVEKTGSPSPRISFLPSAPPQQFLTLPNSSLSCASPSPFARLSWVYTQSDGTNITISTNKGLNILEVGKFMFTSGNYSCILREDNTIIASKSVQVSEYTAPKFLVRPSSHDNFVSGATLRLACEATGFPRPEIIWYRNGHRLHTAGRVTVSGNHLRVSTVHSGDSGLYQCEVAGLMSTARFQLRPGPLPPTPINITCKPSVLQLNISWDMPPSKDDTTITAFTVHFSSRGGSENSSPSGVHNRSIELKNLIPYTNYSVYVRAWSLMASDPSAIVTCSTSEAVPISGPEVKLSALNGCLIAEWEPPTLSAARGVITQYKIQWKTASQNFISFELLPAYIHKYSIPDVSMGEEYFVRVFGSTRRGWPQNIAQLPWQNISVPLQIDRPLPLFRLRSVDTSSIGVQWVPTAHTASSKFYYRKLPDGVKLEVIPLPNATEFIINSLGVGDWYEVGADWCPRVMRVGRGPPPPFSPRLAPSAHSLNISWQPPPQSSFAKLNYSLSLLHLPSGNSSLKLFTTEKLWMELFGLESGSWYEVELKTVDPAGEYTMSSSKILTLTLPQGDEWSVVWRETNSTAGEVGWPSVPGALYYSVLVLGASAGPSLYSASPSQTSLKVGGLVAGSEYEVRVVAVPYPEQLLGPLRFTTSGARLLHTSTSPPSHSPSDQLIGILVGVFISVCFMSVCAMTLVYRRRCYKSRRHSAPHPPPHIEMLSISHPLTPLNGGCPNGPNLKLPVIVNGKIPNGHVLDRNLRITENPQFEEGGEGDGSSRGVTDEGDSLLSGCESVCDGGEPSPALPMKHPDLMPDDGFHETCPA